MKDVKFHTNSHQMKGEEQSRPQRYLVSRPSYYVERNTPGSWRTEHRVVPGLGIRTGSGQGQLECWHWGPVSTSHGTWGSKRQPLHNKVNVLSTTKCWTEKWLRWWILCYVYFTKIKNKKADNTNSKVLNNYNDKGNNWPSVLICKQYDGEQNSSLSSWTWGPSAISRLQAFFNYVSVCVSTC